MPPPEAMLQHLQREARHLPKGLPVEKNHPRASSRETRSQVTMARQAMAKRMARLARVLQAEMVVRTYR
jgi:hypothetical protein